MANYKVLHAGVENWRQDEIVSEGQFKEAGIDIARLVRLGAIEKNTKTVDDIDDEIAAPNTSGLTDSQRIAVTTTGDTTPVSEDEKQSILNQLPDTDTDYSKLTPATLRKKLEAEGIAYPADADKAALVDLLKNRGNAPIVPESTPTE